MSSNDEKIRDFQYKVSDLMVRLEKVGLRQFNKRIADLENSIESFSKNIVRSGLVGITSSGKSSLLNVLLGTGEKFLKEQSKATTNMIVICSKTNTPQLEIHFEDGNPKKVSGKKVLSQSIWKYTSEDENPGNKFNVKYIKLGLPSFLLEGNIEIADTPGLDTYGHKEHEDLTLREFLPQADLIMYLSSIRSPMKEADRKILNKIMDADQRIVFVQTCKGAVVEQSYGESSGDSVADLLERHRNDFKKAIRPYEMLKDAPIVQVETTQAVKYFKNNDKNAWKESGLDEFIYVISNVTKQLQEDFEIRSLRRSVNETYALNKLIISTIEEDSDRERDIEDEKLHLKDMKNHLDKLVNDKDRIVSKWKEELDATKSYFKYEMELSKIFGYVYDYNPMHDKKFMEEVQLIGDKTKQTKNELLNALDNAKNRFRSLFDELGLEVRRADIQSVTQTGFFLPNVRKKKVSEVIEKGEKSSVSIWNKKEVSAEYIDKRQYMDELRLSLKYFFDPLVKHLEWWEQTIAVSYIDSLGKKISALEEDMKNMKSGIYYDDAQYKELAAISSEITSLVSAISPVCNIDPLKRKIKPYKKYTGKVITVERKTNEMGLLMQISNRMYEGMFHSYYLQCLSRITNKEKKSVLIIAQDYETQINFLRRLMRLDNNSFMVLEEIEPPYAINNTENGSSVSNIRIMGELNERLAFLVMSNEVRCLDLAKTEKLFEKADIIQVMIEDLHRVGSAVTDLRERNLFFEMIDSHKEKLLMTYPRAAYFQNERLHILSDEAIMEINNIFHPQPIQWFVYENFEIRFNIFHELALKMRDQKLKPEECLAEWKSFGIPFDGSFSEEVLMEQFQELEWA